MDDDELDRLLGDYGIGREDNIRHGDDVLPVLDDTDELGDF